MKEKSIKKNFAFNLVYQILILIAPLIVTPYVSRVLGVDGIGEYSYANSMVSYFLLFAVLGTGTYGQRAIGYTQKNKEDRSRAFWEVFTIRILTGGITLGAYAIYLFVFVSGPSFVIYAILALNIVNVILDVSWFMQGMEEFGKTATSSIIFRILNIVCVFLFVKEANDLWKYVLITVGSIVLGNLSIWFFLPRNLCKIKGVKPFRDLKSILQLFLPTIATQIYLVLDKSMIGWLSDGYVENGYYEQADKIIKMALTVVTALGIVMIPRIARTYKEGDKEQVKYYIYKSYQYVWMMSIPIMFGLIAVSSVFVPVFFGDGYDKCNIIIPILSVLTIFIGLSNVTGFQFFVSTGKQNVLTFTVIIGAIVNVLLNAILIPFFASVGAAIASVIAELSVTMTGLIYVRRKHFYSLKPILTCSWKYWIAGIIMFGIIFAIKYFVPVTVWALVVLVVVGVVAYFLMLLLLRDKMLFEFLSKFLIALKAHVKHTKSTETDKSENENNNLIDSSVTQLSTIESENDDTEEQSK